MNLLVLMYHRARAGRHGNEPDLLDAHFRHIAGRYANVLPGEPLAAGRLNVCLSFDDGYYDFHSVVLPLLQKYELRALLAVPPLVVRERVDASAGERMALETDEAFAHPSKGAFCTWPELEEIAQSGCAAIAAHGYTHQPLDQRGAALETEIDASQTILGARLRQPVNSFVFPFGKYSTAALQRSRARYRHVFRIGGAMNSRWNERLLYRVNADAMPDPWSVFSAGRLLQYRARYFWNRLRYC